VVVVALNAAYAIRRGGGTRRERLAAVWRGVRDYRQSRSGRQ